MRKTDESFLMLRSFIDILINKSYAYGYEKRQWGFDYAHRITGLLNLKIAGDV